MPWSLPVRNAYIAGSGGASFMDVIYNNTGNILQNVRGIIEITRDSAYQAINVALVQRNWLLGRRIAEEELRRRAYRILSGNHQNASQRADRRIR